MKAKARHCATALAMVGLAAATAIPAASAGERAGTADGPRATETAIETAASAPLATAAATAVAAQRGVPRIRQMVVFRNGKTLIGAVAARRTSVRVDGRRCAIAAATPLAALVHSDPGPLGFHDYGSCGARPADASGVFVKRIRGDRNRGLDGWVYKQGRKLATAGAAEPTGPFGSGRLRSGDEVVWFYCRQRTSGTCQRSLEVEPEVDGRRVAVVVTGYDDAGDGSPIAGATVRSGKRKATTDREGRATLRLPRGRHLVHAAKRGTIRSFARRVVVR